MRNIFHEILARYLESDQHAFDTTPRELWPSERFTLYQRKLSEAARQAVEPVQQRAVYCEPEPQN